MKIKIQGLDYLRGICACLVMLYHFLSWTLGKDVINARNFFGFMGIYGVSTFYVISGYTLSYVYSQFDFTKIQSIKVFFLKRFFRIFPLLWFVCLLVFFFAKGKVDFLIFFLTISGLWGFFKWDYSLSTGLWSIGNELVFYTIFPFISILLKKRLFWMIMFFVLVLFIYFSFYVLTESATLSEQWAIYTNPLNQIIYFLAGILIYEFNSKFNLALNNVHILLVLLIFLALIPFLTIEKDQIYLVTKFNRVIFTFICSLVVFLSTKIAFKSTILQKLGDLSYSIYLIHPFSFNVLGLIKEKFFQFPESFRFILSITLTIVFSYVVHKQLEVRFIKMGNKILNHG